MAKVFTFAEIAEHNTKEDCWVTIFGKVYNVTAFLEEHPGGDEIILKATAKDATNDFTDVGHTHAAWEMLDKYYVGDINKSTINPTVNSTTTTQLHPLNKKAKKSNIIVYLLQFLVPLIILNLIYFGFFSKSSSASN